jgi:hypothetical protein
MAQPPLIAMNFPLEHCSVGGFTQAEGSVKTDPVPPETATGKPLPTTFSRYSFFGQFQLGPATHRRDGSVSYVAPLSAGRSVTRRGAKQSEPKFANACLVEAEVVTNLVTHRLDDLQPEAPGVIAEVAHECVAKDQDLVWQATAPEERGTT